MTLLKNHSAIEPLNAAPVKKARQGERDLLVFQLAGQMYAIPPQDLREIVPMVRLARYPGLPDVLAGFLNLGGTAIPVLRLDRLFGLPELPVGLYTPLIVLRNSNSPLALMVETVCRIVTVLDDAIVPVPGNHSFNDCVVGVATVADRVVLILSPERLLLDKEQQCIAEFQDREQARLRELEGSQT